MGYWNGWSDYAEWAAVNETWRVCQHCKAEFMPVSGNQKYCKDPACRDDRHFADKWDRGTHPLQHMGTGE